MIMLVGFATLLGLLLVSISLNKIADQMSEANDLKRAELKAAGVSLD